MGFTTYLRSAQATTRYVGTCKPCGRPVSATAEGAGDRTRIACPDCGVMVAGERVYGTVSGMACDPRCEGASGPSCECACGGQNHGGAWSQAGEMLASHLEAYRARETRKAAERERRRQAERAAEREAFAGWAADNRSLAATLSGAEGQDWPEFLCDMARIVRRGEALSERQAQAAQRCLDQVAARQAERANAQPVPAGCVTVTGTVATVEVEPNPFGRGMRSRMLVKSSGWRVWVTVPRSLADVNATTPGNHYGLRGKTVRFVCEVERSRSDESCGYGKRPRQAEILEAATA